MSITRATVRTGAKSLAQNVPITGTTGVALLFSDTTDFDNCILQALQKFDQDQPNVRVIDQVLGASGFRVVLKGTGVITALAGQDAWSGKSLLQAVWYPFDATNQSNEPVDPNDYRIVQDPGPKTVLEFLRDTPVAGQTLRLAFTRPHTLSEAPNTVTKPTAPSAALAAPPAPGNIDNGAHSYTCTFVTVHGETEASLASSQVVIVDKAINGQVTLTVPVSSDTGVTARNIYRTVAGDAGTRKLVGTLANNTATTFTDNVADSSLGANAPSANTAGGLNTVDDDDEAKLTLLVAYFILQLAANKATQNTGNTNLPNDIVDRRAQADIFRSRAKELRDEYNSLAGHGGDDEIGPHSGFADLDTEFSDRRGFLWHDRS